MMLRIDKTRSILFTILISLISLFYIAIGIILITIPDYQSRVFYCIMLAVAILSIIVGLIELFGVTICLLYDWSTILEINSDTGSVRYYNKWIGKKSFSLNEIESRIDYSTSAVYRYACTNYAFIRLKDGESILLGMYIENAEQKELFRLDGGSPYETKPSLVYKELFAHILKLWSSKVINEGIAQLVNFVFGLHYR